MKTFKAIVAGTAFCMLYPGYKVIVAAVTKSQAEQDFSETFRGEVVEKFSPILKYLANEGKITWRETDKGFVVTFWNGSMITFCPAIDSSRGIHGNLLIIEECRLIKKNMVDSVVVPMHTQRQPLYKTLQQYIMRRDLDEPVKIFYITSARFANEWYHTLYKKTFVSYFKDKLNKHRVFNSDIFLAIKYGLKSKEWLIAQRNQMDSLNYDMELLNAPAGSADGAYFSYEMFKKNQTIRKGFIPPTVEQFVNGENKNRKKVDGEIRLLFVDFAFASNYKGGTENDNTVIGCMAIVPTENGWKRKVEYLETHDGGEAEKVDRRIRELFWFYQADYIVEDNRSGGEVHYTNLSKEYHHPEIPFDMWNHHGFTVAVDKDIHVVKDGKIEELAQRAIDPQAIPCIIPITATTQQNSDWWIDLSQRLRNEEISFLIDDLDYQQIMVDSKDYVRMSAEEKAQSRLGYIQTMLLVNEAINLTQEWREGILKLKEPSTGYKDRIVACAYGNAIATKIINKMEKDSQQCTEIDWDDIQIVF